MSILINIAINFCFSEVAISEIAKKISKFKATKASQNSNIPIKIIKDISDVFNYFLCKSFIASLKSSKFPHYLKLAYITPLHKER